MRHWLLKWWWRQLGGATGDYQSPPLADADILAQPAIPANIVDGIGPVYRGPHRLPGACSNLYKADPGES